MAKRSNIKDLCGYNVHTIPVHCDWNNTTDPDDEPFRAYGYVTCDNCGHGYVTDIMGECPECYSQSYFEGPMMSYYYPCDIEDLEVAAKAIAHLPVCVVEVEGNYALALTGGGMDLSWEICEAYMRLGSLPPVHFCDLPRIASRGKDKTDRWILAGCRASLRIVKRQAVNSLRWFNHTWYGKAY